jgi:hypothetical protein
MKPMQGAWFPTYGMMSKAPFGNFQTEAQLLLDRFIYQGQPLAVEETDKLHYCWIV